MCSPSPNSLWPLRSSAPRSIAQRQSAPQEQRAQIEQQIAAVDAGIATIEAQIEQIEAQLAQLEEQLDACVANADGGKP